MARVVPPLKTARRPAGRAGGEARGGQRGPLWFLFIYGSLSVRKEATHHHPLRRCESAYPRCGLCTDGRLAPSARACFIYGLLAEAQPPPGGVAHGGGARATGDYSSAGLITRVLSGSRVHVDEASDWLGERIEHSLSDLAVLPLSARPSFYLWLFI